MAHACVRKQDRFYGEKTQEKALENSI